jgi:hypothetical protein
MEGEYPEIGELIDKSKQLLIIAPDKTSGGDFAGTVFNSLKDKGFSVATYYGVIAPRVELDETGKSIITTQTEKVSADLADVVKIALADSGKGHPLTIACNTLSLPKVL